MNGLRIATFRQRLRASQRLVGTFVKTPHHSIVEVLALSPLDCIVLDAEHAPFDRAALDACVLAARAADLPALVRVARADAAEIGNALDLGAVGVLVPHVCTPADAERIAALCRYRHGSRGYSGATRAAGYATRAMQEVLATADAEVTVVLQIEDAAALAQIDAIADVAGADCLFVGRADLTVSMGETDPRSEVVLEAVRRICAAGRARGQAIGMFTPSPAEAPDWLSAGASLFLLASDQQWVLQGARGLVTQFDER